MKRLLMFLILLLIPFNVFAYSEYIIPGGETIGINVDGDGVVVMGFYKVDGTYLNNHLNIGDKIISVADTKVSSVEELTLAIESNIKASSVDISYIRDNKEFKSDLKLRLVNNIYKSGLYIKSSVVGVGVVTYQDEDIYGALGHIINYGSLNKKVEVKSGLSFFSDVTSFIRSKNGNPGSKNANIDYDSRFGTIVSNTEYGIYGFVDKKSTKDKMKVGTIDEVMLGKASIYTTNLDNEIVEYEIKILEINTDDKSKNFYFEVVDNELLEMSGGIVQGMSGSPIIQNNKIIGAVTRVLVDDVKKGYGISIVTMLEEGDKLAK